MKGKAGHIVLLVACAAAALSLSGCGQRVIDQTEAKIEVKTTEAVTEAAVPVTEAETQPQTEPPKLITSVDYTSKDGSVKITLPDNTWKVTQDADEMRVFQSGNDAIINIVHADNQTAMKSLNVMTSKEDLDASLKKQYQEENAYEIEDYVNATMEDIGVYRYTVEYNAAARMWAYAVTNAVIDGEDEAYVVTGTVTEDNKTLLEAVKKAVESFRVLNDDTLRKVTGEVITGTPQVTSEAVQTGTLSAEEMDTLQEYGAEGTLVTNDSVNVRLSPGTDAGVMTTLDKGASVSVTGETKNWFKVVINGNTGYIRKDFLIYPDAAASGTDNNNNGQTEAAGQAAAGNGTSSTMVATSDVNIRNAPGTDSDVIGVLTTGQTVTVTGESDNWYIVSVDGNTGYVSKSYMNSAPASSASGDQQPESTAQPTGQGESEAAAGSTDANAPAAGTNTPAADTGISSVGGTVISSSIDTITIQADDGSTKTIYYGDAGLNTADGIYEGVYVEVSLDPSQANSDDGTLYATNLTGY